MLKAIGLFSILAALNVATVCVFLSAIPVNAGLQQPGPPCNKADINGDGSEGLADAIRLLNYLFNEGPEPVACAEGEKVDVAAEMEAALGKFLPRAEDMFYLSTTFSTDGVDEVIVDVEDGQAFVLQRMTGGSGTLKAGGEVLDRLDVENPDLTHTLLPGEQLTLETDGFVAVRVFGYWLDYEDPEE